MTASTAEKPIVYTIAGADSSGGAGVHADLATFRDFDSHGCALITALTTQTRAGVHRIIPTPVEHLRHEWQQLRADLPPRAIKLGMLVNSEITRATADLLSDSGVPVVCDPVLTATAGGQLLDAPGRAALRQLLPSITLLTPNTLEAAELTGLPVGSCCDVEAAARRLLALGAGAVLITGGHLGYSKHFCHDYFSDGTQSFWLRGERIATSHHHGTGCTLSSAIAASLALGHELVDAVVLGKMAVSRGLRRATPLAGGRGAVAHGGGSGTIADLPAILPGRPDRFTAPALPRCDTHSLGLYPVVDSVDWVEKVLKAGVRTVQLRIKQQPSAGLRRAIRQAVDLQNRYGARLFINDHWQLAIECGAYGVHLGQEDLQDADINAIADAGLRLGVSNHAWHELARAHALAPSYLALGPIFHTTTKVMRFSPQGIPQLGQWVDLLRDHYPLTAIGGIGLHNVAPVAATGVGSIAVVRAITQATDYRRAVAAFNRILETQC